MIIDPIQIVICVIVVTIIVVASHKMGIMDSRGGITAGSIGFSIIILGGWKFFTVLLSFLFIAGIFTKYKYEQKRKLGVAEGNGGARSWQNVLANSVVASFFAIAYGLAPSFKALTAGFLGAVCTSMADTLATELGLLSSSEPKLITNWSKHIKAGRSGGVTLLGEAASLFGVLLIALVAWCVGFTNPSILSVLVSMLAGFLGCTLDSLLGATVQATYKCSVCGQYVETKVHCERPTLFVGGIKVIDNNVVNLISTIFGASISFLVHLIVPL